MPEVKSWSDIATDESNRASGKSSGTIRNLKMIGGRVYVVRFVGEPVKFHKYYIAGKYAVCSDPETCPVRQKYSIDPATKFASNIILRGVYDLKDNEVQAEEPGLLYKWEFPPAITKPVLTWKKIRKQEPGGDNGCDFRVEVTGHKEKTRYNVANLDVTPFTSSEKEMIDRESYDLMKLYKACPPEEIENRLFGDGKISGAPVAASKTVVAAGNDGFKSEDPPF